MLVLQLIFARQRLAFLLVALSMAVLETWQKTHKDYLPGVYSRYGYYFGELRVSTKNPNRLYSLGVKIVRSDDGPQFGCTEFRQFAKRWGFEHRTSSPGYAQSNGKAENAVRTHQDVRRQRGTS